MLELFASKVYAFDHHKGGPDQEQLGHAEVDTEQEFRNNIRTAGIEEGVVPLVMKSSEAAR